MVSDEKIEADHQSVVNGQQRLSINFKAYINHEDLKNIVLDVSRAEFKLIEGEPLKSQIPIGILLNEKAQELE